MAVIFIILNKKVLLTHPGIEPGSNAWKASIITIRPASLQKILLNYL